MSQPDTFPFKIGKKYLIKKNYSELGHSFEQGQSVIFVKCTYDPRLGVSRYWFSLSQENNLVAWHVWDDDESRLHIWSQIFEQRES
jgi:hypothetical protein